MSRAKVFISILIVLILIALSGASVWAAPGGRDPLVEPTEEPTAEPTEEPTAEPTEEPTAEPTEEPTAEPTEEPTAEPTEEPPDEEAPAAVHPVASALAEFFADALGLDYDEVMGYHESGAGFGVIAQACWMSYAMYDPEAETNITPADILEAKKSGDFSSIELPNGETPKNWGQFRKAVLGSDKAKKNLGAIMSGRATIATPEPTEEPTNLSATANQGKGKKGKASDQEVSGASTEPPGKKKDKDKSGGKPAEPPGKKKDKVEDSGSPAEPPGKGKDKDKGGGNDKGGGGSKGKGGGKKN